MLEHLDVNCMLLKAYANSVVQRHEYEFKVKVAKFAYYENICLPTFSMVN